MTEETNIQFEHSELQPRQIRLLRVSHDETTDRIICIFDIVSLDDLEVAYTAISYCWGDAAWTDTVWFDDRRFLRINSSAAHILRDLISEKWTGYIWIDAICIDQDNDKPEKGQQVRLMREIYSLAKQVSAFIGPPSTDSNLAFQFTRTLDNAITDLFRKKEPVTYNAIVESPLCQYPSPSWVALTNLLKRAWFQRVWVIQEVVVAKKVVIVCGSDVVLWSSLARIIVMINGKGLVRLLSSWEDGNKTSLPEGVVNLFATYTIKAARESGASVRLQMELLDTRRFDATDPRDKVFALLGCVTDGDDAALYPDYRKSNTTQDTYTNCTKYLIARDRSLQILHGAGIASPRLFDDLPSWVADWSCPSTGTVFGAIAKTTQYRAAGDTQVQVLEGTQNSVSPELVIEGCLVGNIKKVCLPAPVHVDFTDFSSGNPLRKEQLAWSNRIWDVLEPLKPYPTGETITDVHWRTLIANSGDFGMPAQQEYAQYFKDYWYLKYLMLKSPPGDTIRGATLDMVHGSERWTATWQTFSNRVLFTTDRGYAGLGPPGLKENDVIGILYGAATPFILRNTVVGEISKSTHKVVGECYIHGLMNGEGLDMAQPEPIVLI